MNKKEFIEKWNVAFEDKEQKEEFAHEMSEDLELVIQSSQSPQWIRVEERLPEIGKRVWVTDGDEYASSIYLGISIKIDKNTYPLWEDPTGYYSPNGTFGYTHWAEITQPIN